MTIPLKTRLVVILSPWYLSVLFLVVVALFVRLGLWQLERADEKIRMQAAWDQAANGEVLELADITSADGSASQRSDAANIDKPIHIRVSGRVLSDHQFLWDNRVHQGRAGYEVLVPLQSEADKTIVLVNRGWVAAPGDRSVLPDVSLNTDGRMRLQGLLSYPSRGFSGGDALEQVASWPARVQFLDYAAMAARLGVPADTLHKGVLQIQRSQGEQEGVANDFLYTDNWQPVAFGPEKHYGYAFQWFAMATALVIIFLLLKYRQISGVAEQFRDKIQHDHPSE